MNQNSLSPAERRAFAVLDAYGSNPASWPADERQVILACISRSAALQRYQVQLEDLDVCIASAQVADLAATSEVQMLQQRILASLPAQATRRGSAVVVPGWMRIVNWLITPRHSLALVAIMVLALVLGLHHSAPVMTVNSPGASSFAAWSWYDITGQELPVKQTASALTMTDLVNLEMDQDGG